MKRKQVSADGKDDGEREVDARYKLARESLKNGAYAEAMEQYVWLWENIPSKYPAMEGVRGSFMTSQMARVLSNYPAARDAFERLRAKAKTKSKSGDKDDWIVLNSLLGHDNETLDWFNKSKNDSKQRAAIKRSDFRLDDILIRNLRWADLIFLYPEPLVRLKERHKSAREITESLKNRESRGGEKRDFDPFPKDAALIYAGYLAAGQAQIAEQIAEHALELCNTPAMREQLVAKSLIAHQRKPQLNINWDDEQFQLAQKGSGHHIRQGCRFCDSNKFEQAQNEFDAAVKAQDDGLSTAFMLRGAICLLLGQVDRGIDDLNQAIKIAPTVAFAYRWRGWAHASKFEFDKAIQDYSKAIELDPKDAFAYSGRGRMLWTQHKFRAALQDLDKSIHLDHSNAEAYFLRAACYKQSEDYVSALDDIDQSLRLSPNDREAQYQRASVLDGVKKYEEA